MKHFLGILMSRPMSRKARGPGCLLFILYLNDLPDERLTTNTRVCLIKDDTKISTVFSDISERPDMQECLNEFVVWVDKWQLQVAEHKYPDYLPSETCAASYH